MSLFVFFIWVGGAGHYIDSGKGIFAAAIWPIFLGRALAQQAMDHADG